MPACVAWLSWQALWKERGPGGPGQRREAAFAITTGPHGGSVDPAPLKPKAALSRDGPASRKSCVPAFKPVVEPAYSFLLKLPATSVEVTDAISRQGKSVKPRPPCCSPFINGGS